MSSESKKSETKLAISRRKFLQLATTTSGAFVLGACGGSDSPAAPAPAPATPTPTPPSPGPAPAPPSPTPTPPPPAPSPTPTPLPAPGTLPSFQVTSVTGGAQVPFTLGHAFREGDVPTGKAVVADIADFQAIVKNRWPDGSVKFAILSGHAAMSANVAKTVVLSAANPPAAGSPVTLAQLKATGATASIAYGGYGTVNWSGTDWDTPFLSWISGPEMSSWLYRKPIGADAHLVAWLEVRCYKGGAVEVVPWIENGYLKIASPDQKSGTATFSLGGTSPFSQSLTLKPRQRAVLSSGTVFSHWLGTDPQLSWKHDRAYFESTKLTPAYRGVTSAGSPIWSSLATSYTPLAQANYSNAMTDTGYQRPIGPMPEWDAAYLSSSGDIRAWRSVQVHAYCAGRFPIHYRDEATNRPVRLSQRPNFSINGPNTGITALGGGSSTNDLAVNPSTNYYTSSETWDSAHHPQVGYMAYLITGRFYLMEEAQFCGIINILKNADNQRGFGEGYFKPDISANTQRGAAWAMRSLVMATSASPDDDPLHADLVLNCNGNAAYYNSRFNDSFNLLGVCWSGTDRDYLTTGTTGTRPWLEPMYGEAPWQDDWLTFAFALAKDLKTTSGSGTTALNAFVTWKFKGTTGRFGGSGSTEFCYRHAAQYDLPVMPNDDIDAYAGASFWFQNWGEVRNAMNNGASNTCSSATTLEGTSAAEPGQMHTGYWGNLMPALAYAVDQGATGASIGYARMTSASNWASNAARFNDTPTWGIRARTQSDGPQ